VNATKLTREHLEDLLKSKTFQRSAKLSRLLRRLVEPTLSGASNPIKEQILGIEVFDRPTDWNPQTDSIVRVHINRLRLTLRSYYAEQHPLPAVRFEIPKGSYTARCVLTPPAKGAGPVRLHDIRLQRLTYERGDLTNAAFCPDGESVVYSARWRGEPVGMYSQRIGQKHSRPLGLPPGKLRDVSATGQLLFTLGEGSIGALAQADLSGGPLREIVDGVSDAVSPPREGS
jgi:hypothetical protein